MNMFVDEACSRINYMRGSIDGHNDPFTKPLVLVPVSRVSFDPSNQKHRLSFVTFQRTGKWTIQFNVEWPYVTVPQTVLNKIAEWALRKEFATVEENIGEHQTKRQNSLV